MKRIIYILIGLLYFGNLFSQNSFVLNFQQDESISNENGEVSRFDVVYFPVINVPQTSHYIERNGQKRWIYDHELDLFITEFGSDNIQKYEYYFGITPIHQIWFSRYLYELDEPVLYNYYLNKNIVRFTLLRTFDNPLMIKLEYNADSIILSHKHLDDQLDINLYARLLEGNLNIFTQEKLLNMQENRNVLNNTVASTIDSLIHHTEIKKEIPFRNVIEGLDGADWILEIHDESGYYYICRWSPNINTPIRKIASYLINLREIREEIY